MKSINCDVIKDLLPSYSDKILSSSSNKLVEEHLKKCKNCSETLKAMNKEIITNNLFIQKEQIDYLKGYRKKKRKSVIFTIFLTALIVLTIVMSILNFIQYAEFFINVNDVNVALTQKKENVEYGKDRLTFLTTPLNKKYKLKYYTYEVTEDINNKSLHIKIVGKLGEPARSFYSVDIDTTIKKIYFEDKNGNLKEIWNRDTGLQVEDISGRIPASQGEDYFSINEIKEEQ